MIVVSAVLTNAVLSRLAETQQRHLTQIASLYLEGIALAIRPYVLRDDIWEIFDAIDRSAPAGAALGMKHVVVVDTQGRVLASSSPKSFPAGSDASASLPSLAEGQTLRIDTEKSVAEALKPLRYQDRYIGQISALFDVSTQIAERRDVLRTLLITNAAIALVLAAIGYWLIGRMLHPLRLLSQHLDDEAAKGAAVGVQPISLPRHTAQDGEFGRLFTRFNAMAEAVNERELLVRQLAKEERLASLGRLASGMAHEINNPLGGLFNTIDTLKQHGARPAVRASSLALLERGLRDIRDVVRTALATYRAEGESRMLTRSDLDDLLLLIGPEAARKNLDIQWNNAVAGSIPFPASPVRQIVLNLMLNSVAASPAGARVGVSIDAAQGQLVLQVSDSGGGLPADALDLLQGRSKNPIGSEDGIGLGLWITRRLVDELHGRIEAFSVDGGSQVKVVLPPGAGAELHDAA